MSEKIVNIKELHEFKDNPYQVKDNEDMKDLIESIKEYGVIEPLIVRNREKGGYEIVSGHGVRIDIWTHFMRECIINYVH